MTERAAGGMWSGVASSTPRQIVRDGRRNRAVAMMMATAVELPTIANLFIESFPSLRSTCSSHAAIERLSSGFRAAFERLRAAFEGRLEQTEGRPGERPAPA